MNESLHRDVVIFILAVLLVIIAQFWYDAILEIFKTILKRDPLWYDYLVSSVITSIIFLIILLFIRIPVTSIV